MLSSRGLLALALGACAVGCAHRDPQPPRIVGVRIESGGPPLHMELTPDSASALRTPTLQCGGICERAVWTGTYRFTVDAAGVSGLDRTIHVDRPLRIRVRPRSAALRDGGLVLAIIADIVLPVSLYAGLLCGIQDEHGCRGWWYAAGISAVGIPVGWFMYSQGKSDVDVTPMGPRVAMRAPSRERAPLSWTWTF